MCWMEVVVCCLFSLTFAVVFVDECASSVVDANADT